MRIIPVGQEGGTYQGLLQPRCTALIVENCRRTQCFFPTSGRALCTRHAYLAETEPRVVNLLFVLKRSPLHPILGMDIPFQRQFHRHVPV